MILHAISTVTVCVFSSYLGAADVAEGAVDWFQSAGISVGVHVFALDFGCSTFIGTVQWVVCALFIMAHSNHVIAIFMAAVLTSIRTT